MMLGWGRLASIRVQPSSLGRPLSLLCLRPWLNLLVFKLVLPALVTVVNVSD